MNRYVGGFRFFWAWTQSEMAESLVVSTAPWLWFSALWLWVLGVRHACLPENTCSPALLLTKLTLCDPAPWTPGGPVSGSWGAGRSDQALDPIFQLVMSVTSLRTSVSFSKSGGAPSEQPIFIKFLVKAGPEARGARA